MRSDHAFKGLPSWMIPHLTTFPLLKTISGFSLVLLIEYYQTRSTTKNRRLLFHHLPTSSHYKMIRISCLVFLLLVFLFPSSLTDTGNLVSAKGNSYVREACSVTMYPDLCIHSLASFSSTARNSPSKWARAGVSVTISEVKNVQAHLAKLKRYRRLRGRNRAALSDCIETFADALDELHRSLGVLRRLSRSTFSDQMDDLNTWISAALTDEDTCLDGFEGRRERQIKLLQNKVQNVSHITSNALALVNKLATTGLGSITDP